MTQLGASIDPEQTYLVANSDICKGMVFILNRYYKPAGSSVEVNVSQMGKLSKFSWCSVDDFAIDGFIHRNSPYTMAVHGTGLRMMFWMHKKMLSH